MKIVNKSLNNHRFSHKIKDHLVNEALLNRKKNKKLKRIIKWWLITDKF